MRVTSTADPAHHTTFFDAVSRGIAPGGGLYMPEFLPLLPEEIRAGTSRAGFADIAFEVIRHFAEGDIPESELRVMVDETMNFPVPIRHLDDRLSVLELFHGPTLAFKDFGARFLGRVLSYQRRNADREVTVLVATSGDTGSAVASGCSGVPGVRVVLLFPAGKVSKVQELQLTTGGPNITTLRVDGTFDDCQRMVKQAFVDQDLRTRLALTSANSINIARLLPQIFYYVSAWQELAQRGQDVVFVVPSGNLGNLTAGVFARAMGIPFRRFVAASNANDVLPEYLRTGVLRPRPAVSTLSNAMDVGDPNNTPRLQALFGGDIDAIRAVVTTDVCSDDQTRGAIDEAYRTYHYTFDPHGAVGYFAAKRFLSAEGPGTTAVVLGTAHPAKFPEVYPEEIRARIPVPEQLRVLTGRPRRMLSIRADFDDLKSILLHS
jgi:threonine synthase